MTRRNASKPNIVLCAAFVLLCLTMITTHLTSGLYARYVTSDSGQDSARVIKFGNLTLTETGDFVSGGDVVPAVILPGVNLKKDVNVYVEPSETDTIVFVSVAATAQWNLTADHKTFYLGTSSKRYVEWSVFKNTDNDGPWTYLGEYDGKLVYYHLLESNEAMSYDFIATKGTADNEYQIFVSEEITKTEMNSLTDDTNQKVLISLQAYVVQSGFDSVEAAWISVSN